MILTPFRGSFAYNPDGKLQFKMPEGRYYLASFPLALEIPAIRDRTFYAHHSVNRREKWTVTEAATGFRIAGGRTRKEAMTSACDTLRRAGQDRFLQALANAEATIARAKEIT